MAYLQNVQLRATSSTMSIASSVLGFDIVELWSEEDSGAFHCTYVHADESFKLKYPDIITGHYPNHTREHKRSPTLCQLAKASTQKYHWQIYDQPTKETTNGVKAPVRTEMACLVQGRLVSGINVFIVGFSVEKITHRISKLEFLSGLGYAIYVAAFDLDEEDGDGERGGGADLDLKQGRLSMTKSFSSFSNLASMVSSTLGLSKSSSKATMGVAAGAGAGIGAGTDSPSSSSTGDGFEDLQFPRVFSDGSEGSGVGSPLGLHRINSEDGLPIGLPLGSSSSDLQSAATSPPSTPIKRVNSSPTLAAWEQLYPFSFPISQMPIKSEVPSDLSFASFADLTHIADGSNSNIYTARWVGEKVIIKAIREDVVSDEVAAHEFEIELGVLSRVAHTHVIKLLGAGRDPRRFLVLEYLGGGSLHTILAQNQEKPGFAQKLFRRPNFTYSNLLSKARDIAEALDFLHTRAHPGAVIIHRDLKPDNVGFTADGSLKLFDFGLCTCVRARSADGLDESYEMTGNTGSLRYMAPEVALRQPYSEKVDVYSFGIMVWQMARDRVPFKGMDKEEFMRKVVVGGERPKLDRSWPPGFSALLTSCWEPVPALRLSFAQVVAELGKLMDGGGGGGGGGKGTWVAGRPLPLLKGVSMSVAVSSPQNKKGGGGGNFAPLQELSPGTTATTTAGSAAVVPTTTTTSAGGQSPKNLAPPPAPSAATSSAFPSSANIFTRPGSTTTTTNFGANARVGAGGGGGAQTVEHRNGPPPPPAPTMRVVENRKSSWF